MLDVGHVAQDAPVETWTDVVVQALADDLAIILADVLLAVEGANSFPHAELVACVAAAIIIAGHQLPFLLRKPRRNQLQ